MIGGSSHYDSWFMANSGKSVNLKKWMTHFYLFKMIFLQHIARGINSGIIIVNVQRESGLRFWRAMLSGTFIDVIPVFLKFLT